MKKQSCAALLIFLCLPQMTTGNVLAATPEAINASVQDGIGWLASQQQADGSWTRHVSPGTSHQAGSTGFAVAVLCHHAESLGLEPLSPSYAYRQNVQDGLNYLFRVANRDSDNNRVWWTDSGWYSNYETGPPLMAISRSHAPNALVHVPGSTVHGMTYLQVAQEVVNYLAYTQGTTGNNLGAWGYDGPDSGSDQSATGFVTLGLGYALLSFGIPLPDGLLEDLSTFIDYIQYLPDPPDQFHGGSGYWGPTDWINMYKTGHLLYQMALVGDNSTSPRMQAAFAFLERHWDVPNSGTYGHASTANSFPDVGWRGGPGDPPSPLPSYIAVFSMKTALLLLNITHVGSVDWYDDFTDVIVANQYTDGSWEQGGYPPSSNRTLSTCWALMTMLRATPTEIQPEPTEPAAIPTLSEWGLILMALLLGYTAYTTLRRRDMPAA